MVSKKKMKRLPYTIFLTILFVLAVSLTLKYLPFDQPPEAFKALFAQSSYGTLAWLKTRQLAVVGVAASMLALLLIRQDKEKARGDAMVIGVITVLWGFVSRMAIAGLWGMTWYEAGDYFSTGLAVPLLVAIIVRITKVSTGHDALRRQYENAGKRTRWK